MPPENDADSPKTSRNLTVQHEMMVETGASGLTADVKSAGKRIGFDLVGVAPAVSPGGFSHFQDWLKRGHAGEMGYLPNRETAYEHPDSVLDGVRSVIVLAVNYHAESGETTSGSESTSRGVHPLGAATSETVNARGDKPHGSMGTLDSVPTHPTRVARYAQGTADYHDVLRSKLRALGDFLHERVPGCRTRGVVDTAPLLERDFAKIAGLGWFGKNTMLINKRLGSWLFLAALLTDVELEYDAPHETSHCGTCTRCLDACPTDAFPEPYVLDARKCISYLNIELRAPIPEELRDGVGDWLFGCDICQDVCPWNTKSPFTIEPAFQPDANLSPIDAGEILQLDEAAFRQRFRKTPLSRPKRAGLLRTAAIVLGNSGSPAVVPVLIAALNDVEPLIRGACAWALGKIGGKTALAALQTRHVSEDNPTVIEELQNAMQRFQ